MRALPIALICLFAIAAQAKTVVFLPVATNETEEKFLADFKTALKKTAPVFKSGWVLDPRAEARRQKADRWIQLWFERPQGVLSVTARTQSVGSNQGWWARFDNLADPTQTPDVLADRLTNKPTEPADLADAAFARGQSNRRDREPGRSGLSVNIDAWTLFANKGFGVNVGSLLGGYHYFGLGVRSFAPESDPDFEVLALSFSYRFHLSGRQDSWFLGINPMIFSVKSPEGPFAPNGSYLREGLFVGGGRRWVYKSINATVRAGFPVAGFEEAAPELDGTDALDVELSLGWIF